MKTMREQLAMIGARLTDLALTPGEVDVERLGSLFRDLAVLFGRYEIARTNRKTVRTKPRKARR